LANLAPYLPEPLLGEALAVVRTIKDDDHRERILKELAPQLAKVGHHEEALAIAQVMGNNLQRARILTELAPHLPDEVRENALCGALEATLKVGDEYRQYRAQELANPAQDRGVITLRASGAEELATLAPLLSEPLLRKAFAAVLAISDVEDQAEALAGLAPHLPESLRQEALVVLVVLARLPFLLEDLGYPNDIQDRAFLYARDSYVLIHHEEVLIGLALLLAKLGHPEKALTMAREVDKYRRAKALVVLAPHLPEPFLREALAMAREIKEERWQAEALVGLAPYFPELLLHEALDMAREIKNDRDRARTLLGLVPYLPKVLQSNALREALNETRGFEYDGSQVSLLEELAPLLPEPLLEEALSKAHAFRSVIHKMGVLAGLASSLSERRHLVTLHSLWCETLHALISRTRRELSSALGDLSQVIVALGGEDAAIETIRAIQYVGRWWP
jgi:hypothetical protein